MQFTHKKLLSMAASLLACVFFSSNALAAMPPEQNIAPPGDTNFVSLNQYSTPTDIPGVYKITLDIVPPEIKPPPVLVTFVLDRSGSMADWYAEDFWDTDAIRFTSRDLALRKAVTEAIDVLEASGNEDIYINIISYNTGAGAGVLPYTGGLLKLHASPGSRIPRFQKVGGVVSEISGFTGNGGTDISAGLVLAYNDLRLFLSANPTIAATATPYILIMGDGNDGSKAISQNYAAALKASPTLPTVAGIGPGLGAKIWTLVMAQDVSHRTDWASHIFTSTIAAGDNFTDWMPSADPLYYESVASPRVHNAESHLALMSLDIDPTLYPATAISSGATPITAARTFYNGKSGSFNYYFSTVLKADHTTFLDRALIPVVGPPFYVYPKYVRGTTPLLNVFSNFARAASGGGKDITVDVKVNSEFEIYQMSGKPIVEMITTDPDTSIAQTVKRNGQAIEWDLNKMNGGFNYQIVYYVRFLGDMSDPRLSEVWRFVNSEAYISFTDASGNSVVKYFPENIVQLTNVATSSPTLHAPVEPTAAANAVRIGEIPVGTPMAPYTPSPPQKIASEDVSEGAIEVPSTGVSSQLAVITIAIILVAAAAMAYYLSKKNNKNTPN